MKLLGSTKSKIARYINVKNVPNLEITEADQYIVVLLITIIIRNQESCTNLLLIKLFAQLLDILLKKCIFSETFD